MSEASRGDMHAAAAPPPVPVLPYAGAAARSGMSSQRVPAGFRLVISPVPSWRYLSKWYWAALLPAFAACVFSKEALRGNGGWPESRALLFPACEFGFIGIIIMAHALWRLRHRLVIDVTRDELAISLISLGGFGSRGSWPRGDVREVKINPHNRRLLLRIAGSDFLEYPLSTDPGAARWAAEAVRQAVFETSFAEAPGHDRFSLACPAAHRRRVRMTAVALGAAATLAGLLFLVFGRATGSLLVAVALVDLAILTVSAGLLYGTQEKDLFT